MPMANATPVAPKSSMTPVLVLLVIVLLIGVGGLGFYLYRQNQQKAAETTNTQQDTRPNTTTDTSKENTVKEDTKTDTTANTGTAGSADAEATALMLGIQSEFQSLIDTGETLESLSTISTAADAVVALEGAKKNVDKSIANIKALPRVSGDEELRAQSVALFEFINTYLDEIIDIAKDSSKSETEIMTAIQAKTMDFQTEATTLVTEYQSVIADFTMKYPTAIN